jgi:hypothetical protein
MQPRPKPPYLRVMTQAEPSHALRNKLVYQFKQGGHKEFEGEFKEKYKDVSIVQPITFLPPKDFDEKPADEDSRDPRGAGQITRWVYVGDGWWCRSIKQKSTKYQFAQLMAVHHRDACNEVDGPWDARKHVVEPPHEIVYSGEKKGVIVGHDRSGVQVAWFDKDGKRELPVTVRKFEDIEFEYIDDRLKYKRIFAGVK